MTHRLQLIALMTGLVLTVCPAFGQGVGTPAGTGFVPSLNFDHLEVGLANHIRVADLSPGSPMALFVGEAPQPLSLSHLGLGPAVLSPNPSGPAPALMITGLTSDASGELVIPFVASPGLIHRVFHFQALALDNGALFGGAALSESRAQAFGLSPTRVPVAVTSGNGRRTLIEVFPYGTLAAPIDQRLVDLAFVDLTMSNDNEMSFGRDDRPVTDLISALSRCVRLPDGSLILLGVDASHRSKLLRVRSDGRVQILFDAAGTIFQPAFDPQIGVSAHDPFLALVAENPLPNLGPATLFLVRTDGKNVTGSHLPFVGIPTPGFAPESTSLCFLDGALFVSNGASLLRRVDLTTFAMTPVSLPASGGQTPIYVDETCAPADDGSALAIGAGVDDENHDIYVVTAAGVATNLTNLVGDYEDSGPFEPDGMQLAMNANGTQVAYMRTVIETETFVQSTSSVLAHVTNAQQYINSIDTVVGLGFATVNTLTLVAGQDEVATDLFSASLPSAGGPVTQITNLSATSGQTAPVFGLGSTLQLTHRFGGTQTTFHVLDDLNGTHRLEVVDAASQSSSLPLGLLEATSAGPGFTVIVDRVAGSNAQRIRVVSDQVGASVGATWQSPPNGILVAKSFDSLTGASVYLIRNLLTHQVVVCDPSGQLTAHAQPAGAGLAGNSITFDGNGSILVPFLNAAGQLETHRLNLMTGTWSQIGGAIPAQFGSTFLR